VIGSIHCRLMRSERCLCGIVVFSRMSCASSVVVLYIRSDVGSSPLYFLCSISTSLLLFFLSFCFVRVKDMVCRNLLRTCTATFSAIKILILISPIVVNILISYMFPLQRATSYEVLRRKKSDSLKQKHRVRPRFCRLLFSRYCLRLLYC
jgi:hypothetical protein